MPADPNETPAFNLDELKFLPAWMKEEPGAPPKYREYRDEPERPRRPDEYRRPGPPRGDRDRDRDRRPAGPGGYRARPGGGRDGGGFSNRGPRPGGGHRAEGDRRGQPSRDARPGDRNGGGRPHHDERDARGPAPAPVQPAPVRVEFLPDPRGLASIAKQIRASHLAYPLFGMARMFLSRPERHRVRLSADGGPTKKEEANGNGAKGAPTPTAITLFQLGEDGPVALDKTALERLAFERFRDQYYKAETIQKDPPKGNFTNVARERLSGTLLGPTNHHAYQTNLRALYDSRFSRRMSFEQYRRGVEVVSDPALVERWKEETRTTTVFTVRSPESAATPAPAPPSLETQPASETAAVGTAPSEAGTPNSEESPAAPAAAEAAPAPEPPAEASPQENSPASPPPLVLQSLAEARQHFREHYFEALVRSGASFELPGEVARNLPEPGLVLAIRLAHDREIKYPGGLVQPLRAGLQNTGLHVFKHRKRVVYVSIARPTLFQGGDSAVSETVAAILDAVTKHPLCTRKQLAEHVLAQRFGGTTATNAFSEPGAPTAAVEGAKPDEAAAPSSATDVAAAPTPSPETATTETAASDAAPPAASQDAALAKAKAGLAADLRYLVQAGHIIEFHNGTFDLPLSPKPKEPPAAPTAAGTGAVATPEETPASARSEPTALGNEEPAAAPAPESEAAPSAPPNLPAAEAEVLNIATPELSQPDHSSPQTEATPTTNAAPASEEPLPVWEEPPMNREDETATTPAPAHEPVAEAAPQPEGEQDRPQISP